MAGRVLSVVTSLTTVAALQLRFCVEITAKLPSDVFAPVVLCGLGKLPNKPGAFYENSSEHASVEHASFRHEIVLHVHNNDRSSGRINRDRLGFCVERN